MFEFSILDPRHIVVLRRVMGIPVESLPNPFPVDGLLLEAPHTLWTALLVHEGHVATVESFLGYRFRNINLLKLIFVNDLVAQAVLDSRCLSVRNQR
jgi:hypothetical protein